MSITKYIQKCDYRLGGLKPHIYFIHKNVMCITYKANGIEVFFKQTKDADIYKLNAALCTYNQEETKNNKYKFSNTLEVLVNEQYEEPFLYSLRTLRMNQYYIVIEDKNGIQYLINPDLHTVFNYEYNFSDGSDGINGVTMTWNNLSNYPLLAMEKKIENNYTLLLEQCTYVKGEVDKLSLISYKDLYAKNDGVKYEGLYMDNGEKPQGVDFLKGSFSLVETYDGNMFRTTLSFSIPLDDNQFSWAYNLLEYQDNVYKAIVATTNNNYLLIGDEIGLTPSYSITTSEEEDTPNMVNISLTQLSQYPILYSNDIKQYRWFENGEMCFGFDKYQMLTREYSEDWGETWVVDENEVKKKGDIIESNSVDCIDVKWVDETYCLTTSMEVFDFRVIDGYICSDGNKYKKTQKYTSIDGGVTFNPTEEYGIGELIALESDDCNSVEEDEIRWVEDLEYGIMCYPVDEQYTKLGEPFCLDIGSYAYEMVSNNGVDFYKVGEPILLEECSEDCGCNEDCDTRWVDTNETVCIPDIYTITISSENGTPVTDPVFVGEYQNHIYYYFRKSKKLCVVDIDCINQSYEIFESFFDIVIKVSGNPFYDNLGGCYYNSNFKTINISKDGYFVITVQVNASQMAIVAFNCKTKSFNILDVNNSSGKHYPYVHTSFKSDRFYFTIDGGFFCFKGGNISTLIEKTYESSFQEYMGYKYTLKKYGDFYLMGDRIVQFDGDFQYDYTRIGKVLGEDYKGNLLFNIDDDSSDDGIYILTPDNYYRAYYNPTYGKIYNQSDKTLIFTEYDVYSLSYDELHTIHFDIFTLSDSFPMPSSVYNNGYEKDNLVYCDFGINTLDGYKTIEMRDGDIYQCNNFYPISTIVYQISITITVSPLASCLNNSRIIFDKATISWEYYEGLPNGRRVGDYIYRLFKKYIHKYEPYTFPNKYGEVVIDTKEVVLKDIFVDYNFKNFSTEKTYAIYEFDNADLIATNSYIIQENGIYPWMYNSDCYIFNIDEEDYETRVVLYKEPCSNAVRVYNSDYDYSQITFNGMNAITFMGDEVIHFKESLGEKGFVFRFTTINPPENVKFQSDWNRSVILIPKEANIYSYKNKLQLNDSNSIVIQI